MLLLLVFGAASAASALRPTFPSLLATLEAISSRDQSMLWRHQSMLWWH